MDDDSTDRDEQRTVRLNQAAAQELPPVSEAVGGIPLASLRRLAADAGIDGAAFDAAFQRAGDSIRVRPPRWVRLCMLGVPDRQAAKGFYWLFVLGLLAVLPAVKFHWVSDGKGIFAICWLVFSLWSTSAAIRWLDRHGWETEGSRGSSGA